MPVGKTDKNDEKHEKLGLFKKKVMGPRNAAFFLSPHELAAHVTVALVDLQRKRPAVGWVRGDEAMSPEIRAELAELRASANAATAHLNQPVFPDLEDGQDEYEFEVKFSFKDDKEVRYNATFDCHATWNEIFSGIAPQLLHETHGSFDGASCLTSPSADSQRSRQEFDDVAEISGVEIESFNTFSDVLVQFLALGLIERGTAKRTVSDRQKYWKLTDEGESRMMQLRARRRNSEV